MDRTTRGFSMHFDDKELPNRIFFGRTPGQASDGLV